LRFLIHYQLELQWKDRMVPYNEAKCLITTVVFEDNAIVYVKRREKRTWLWNLVLDDERERISKPWMQFTEESLSNLDVTNII